MKNAPSQHPKTSPATLGTGSGDGTASERGEGGWGDGGEGGGEGGEGGWGEGEGMAPVACGALSGCSGPDGSESQSRVTAILQTAAQGVNNVP